MEQAIPGNLYLLHLLNGAAGQSGVLRDLARFCASDLVWLLVLALAAIWLAGTAEMRRRLFFAGVAAAAGLLANMAIGGLLDTPRPFAAGLAQQLVAHAADASFPSDHGALFWAVGLCLGARGPLMRFGGWVSVAGLAVAFGRVALGVHYPLDFLGAFLVAFAAVVLVLRQERRLEPLARLAERGHAWLGVRALWLAAWVNRA